MYQRVRLYSALNVVGWVVVMPVLLVALMSPFVSFSAWPGAPADRASGTKVAMLPPRLSEHGSLPALTEAPQPSAKVPVHRVIAATFTPAPASAPAAGSRRRQAAPAPRRGSAPPRSRRPASRGGARPALRTPAAATPAVTPGTPAQPAPSGGSQPDNPTRPDRPADPPPGRPDRPGRPAQTAPAQDPQAAPGKSEERGRADGQQDRGRP